MAQFQEALRLRPKNCATLSGLAFVYPEPGRHAEAIRAGERRVEVAPNDAGAFIPLAYAHARPGTAPMPSGCSGRWKASQGVFSYDLANVHAALGNRARARPAGEGDRAFRDRWREPRVQRLLEKMGLPMPRS